jgi:two-component sensor histidine kinase
VLEVINLAISNGDSLKLAEAYYLLGKYEVGIGNLYIGKAWHLKSLRILKQYPISHELGRIYQSLAYDESELKNDRRALLYADTAKIIFTKIKSPKGLIASYFFFFRHANQYNDSLKISQLLRDFPKMEKMVIATGKLEELGYMYQYKGEALLPRFPEEAVRSFQKAKEWYIKNDQPTQLNAVNFGLVKVYVNNREFKKARKLFDNIAIDETENSYNRFTSYFGLYNETKLSLLEAEHRWEEAFIAQKQLEKFNEGIRKNERQNLLGQSEYLEKLAMSNTMESELMLQAEKLKETQNRNIFAIIAALIAVFAGLVFYFQSKKYKKLSYKNLKISQKNELLIKEQSHRVKNNLQVVSSLIGLQINRLKDSSVKDSLEETQGRIAVMSLLQQVLYENENGHEIFLDSFFSLISEKNQSIFNVFPEINFNIIHQSVNPEVAMHLGVIYNELITNSFKYAFGFENTEPKIYLSTKIENNKLNFHFADNGKNPDLMIFEKNYYATSQTFGLSLIRLKSEELNGRYTFFYEDGLHFKLEFDYDQTQSINS